MSSNLWYDLLIMTTLMLSTGEDMQWQPRWLPMDLLGDDYEMKEDDIDCIVDTSDTVTIGTEPIITPASVMTFEQIVMGAKLCNAVKQYFLEKEKPAPAQAQNHFRRGVRTRSHREIGRLTSRYGRTKKSNRKHY